MPDSVRYQYIVVRQSGPTALAVATGMTPGLFAEVQLSSGVHTALVRACPTSNGASCQMGLETGWGHWSNVAGGSAQITVAP